MPWRSRIFLKRPLGNFKLFRRTVYEPLGNVEDQETVSLMVNRIDVVAMIDSVG